jgi:fibronectin type 3 domain-containing protein
MHVMNGATLNGRILHTLLAGVLAVGLAAFGAGCGGAGSGSAPDAPAALEADAQDASVSLSWEANEDAEVYNVYRATSSTSGAEGDPTAGGVSGTSYTDDAVENGQTYYYRVTAVDDNDNESDPSGEVPSTPFATPSGLAGTSADAEIELEWSASAGAESYNVYRSESPTDGVTGDPIATEVSEMTYPDSDVTNGTKYYYRVTAVNPEGEESDGSGEIAKTPFSSPPDRPEE